MSKHEAKTNAMRILDRAGIEYSVQTYECGEFTSGIDTADKLGQPYDKVFKTLVTKGEKDYFVFVLPINAELDLKKAAKSVSQKSLKMLHVKEINSVTGYIRGGCTAIGMKKKYRTVIDSSAESQDKIFISGGKIGTQIELSPLDLKKAADAEFCDVTF